MAPSSDLIILFMDKLEPEITGQKDIIMKELNSLTLFSMLLECKLKDVTVSKDSRSPNHWEEELDQEWELS